MGTAEEYRRIGWDCLKLAEATSNPQTSASMLNLAPRLGQVGGTSRTERSIQIGRNRAKAWECLSLAESVDDPEQRADLLLFARMWLSLTEPIKDELRGAYELPPRLAA